jgi:eukaryotic-like serine/threonine-protein kinase
MKVCPSCQSTYPDDYSVCPRDGAPLTAQSTETEAQLAAGLSRRYRIVRRLGNGGMGTVFLAQQIGVGNRPVALKVLNHKLLDDPEFLLRFQNEAGSTGRISHPNVVTIYESAQAKDGTPFIAMEFLEGESLADTLMRRGALPVTEAADILLQAARGLNAAHKLGIIHRDLKPDNIFLTHNDEGKLVVKVVDFGIAKMRESPIHTKVGVPCTPAYMSPEQASGMRSDELDARSDIYSLGVVVYKMVAGRLPFQSDTDFGYADKHKSEEPPPFSAVAPGLGIPPAVESAIMKALVKDREKRYAFALDFARELASAAQPPPRAEAPVQLPATRIVPLPALEVSQPLPSPKVAVPPTLRESDAPMPLPAIAQVKVDTAAQTPTPRLQGGKPVAAGSHAPTVAKSPQVRAISELPNNKMKFVVIAVVALILIAAGAWHFRPSPSPPAAGTVRENPKDGLKYVWIAPGKFMMGCSPGDTECSDNEKSPHRVTITKGFWMGQTVVTVSAYNRFAAATGKAMPNAPDFNPGWSNEQMPIVNINWNEAQDYCAWAGGRLPTEAEWEYAGRGGSTETRYGPIDEVAWYFNNSGQKTHEVGQKRANGFGLYDMLGNVWEWVNDWYDQNYYRNSPSQDPIGPASGQLRVLRGGSWYYNPRYVRVTDRVRYDPGDWSNDLGFRCSGEVFVP